MKSIIIIIALLLVSSCSSTKTAPVIDKKYYMDVYLKSGEQEATGIISLPIQSTYNIKIWTAEKVDAIYMRTCSREIIKEDPRRGVLKKEYVINYTPNEIEKSTGCPANIVAYNTDGYYGIGFISFETKTNTLPATNICENITAVTNGTSVCQSRISLMEKIKFESEVLAEFDPGCELDKNRGTEFTYQIKPGFCVFSFLEIKAPNRIHKLHTYGYDSVQVR